YSANEQTNPTTASDDYTVKVTSLGCPSTKSAATTVKVNPIPAAPSISAGSATTFCDGGSVTLTSTPGTGVQWYRGGVAIGGANSSTYIATLAGTYTATVTSSGCTSPASTGIAVTVNATPTTPTIT